MKPLAAAATLLGLLLPTLALAGSTTGGGKPQAQPQIIFETARLTASDGDIGDEFGGAVAIDGDYGVVGAVGDDSLGFDSGAAYVYHRDPHGNVWTEVAKLRASDGATGDELGGAVAIAGDIVVVGARYEDGTGTDVGAAYVYQRDAGGPDAWGQVAKLTAADGADDQRFGTAVTVDDDTVAVGAAGDGQLGVDAGAVYVFLRDAGGQDAWGQVAKLTALDGRAGDLFGTALDLDRDALAVGTPQARILGEVNGAGAVYVFDRDPVDRTHWTQSGRLAARDGDFGDLFGFSVGISGDRVVAGAALDDELGLDAGSAYIFERDQGEADNWGQVIKLTAFEGEQDDAFGISVAIDGDRVVVGALFDDDSGHDAGAAHVFVRDFNGDGKEPWREEAKLRASNGAEKDYLGSSVAWDASQVLVGALGAETTYHYDLSFFFEPTPSCVVFDDFCDRLNLVSNFLTITGTWQNWDCEGAEEPLRGFPLPDDTARVFCRTPGCPLGNYWAHILHYSTSTWDLWRADGGPPPFLVRFGEPITVYDAPCDEIFLPETRNLLGPSIGRLGDRR